MTPEANDKFGVDDLMERAQKVPGQPE